MNPILASCSALAFALGLAGCAGTAPPRTAMMGAGPECDLSVDVGADHRCAMTHVTPPDEVQQLTNGMRTEEIRTAPRPVTVGR
jgi:hypothetical protein